MGKGGALGPTSEQTVSFLQCITVGRDPASFTHSASACPVGPQVAARRALRCQYRQLHEQTVGKYAKHQKSNNDRCCCPGGA